MQTVNFTMMTLF